MRQSSCGTGGRPSTAIAMSVRALMVVTVLVSSAAACSSSPPSSSTTPTATATTSAASAAYCDDLQALDTNVDQLRSLDPSTATAAQVQSIIVDAQNNLNKAAQDATGTASVKIDAIKTTYSALVAALSAVPTSLSGVQVFQQVQPQITALVTSVNAARAGSGCPSPTAT